MILFLLHLFCLSFVKTLLLRNTNCCSGSYGLPYLHLLAGEKEIWVTVNHFFFFAHLLLNLTERPLLHLHFFSAAVPRPRSYQQTRLWDGWIKRGFCQAHGQPYMTAQPTFTGAKHSLSVKHFTGGPYFYGLQVNVWSSCVSSSKFVFNLPQINLRTEMKPIKDLI